MRLICPRCGGRARRVYVQESAEGRAWRGLVEFLYCEPENAMVRTLDKRRLIASA